MARPPVPQGVFLLYSDLLTITRDWFAYGVVCKWQYAIHLLCLPSFTQHMYYEICLCCQMCQLLYSESTLCPSVLTVTALWVVSTSRLLEMKLV